MRPRSAARRMKVFWVETVKMATERDVCAADFPKHHLCERPQLFSLRTKWVVRFRVRSPQAPCGPARREFHHFFWSENKTGSNVHLTPGASGSRSRQDFHYFFQSENKLGSEQGG